MLNLFLDIFMKKVTVKIDEMRENECFRNAKYIHSKTATV